MIDQAVIKTGPLPEDHLAGGLIKAPEDSGAWRRLVMPSMPDAEMARSASAGHAAIRRIPVRMVGRNVDLSAKQLDAMVEQVRTQCETHVGSLTLRFEQAIHGDIERMLPSLGTQTTNAHLRSFLDQMRLASRDITGQAGREESDLEAANKRVITTQQTLQQASARWFCRLLLRGIIRRAGRRVVDALVAAAQTRARHVRSHAAAELIQRVDAVANELGRNLDQNETSLLGIVQHADASRHELEGAQGRLPHRHVEPASEWIDHLSEDSVFPREALDQVARRLAGGLVSGEEATALVDGAVEKMVKGAMLPTSVASHLASLPADDRQRLFSLVTDEAVEAATVSVLQAPGRKRWRLRVIQVPAGQHAQGTSEALEQHNPEGVHTRVVAIEDPSRVIETIEERGLAACQCGELRRAEEQMHRLPREQWPLSVTVFDDAEEVMQFRMEHLEDRLDARHTFLMALVLGVAARDRSNMFVLTNGWAAQCQGLARGRIARGFEGAIDRLAREPDVRRDLAQLVALRRSQVGDRHLAERLQALRLPNHLKALVPDDAVMTMKSFVNESLRDLAPALVEEPHGSETANPPRSKSGTPAEPAKAQDSRAPDGIPEDSPGLLDKRGGP